VLVVAVLVLGSQLSSESVVQGIVDKSRVIQSQRLHADPPNETLLRWGLALSGMLHWNGGWGLAGAVLLGALGHVRRARREPWVLLPLALVVATVWYGSAGPVADFTQFRRAFTELSPVGAAAAALQSGAAAAVLFFLLRGWPAAVGQEGPEAANELRIFGRWLAAWGCVGLLIAAASGAVARRNFEQSALGRVRACAALLDREELGQKLSPAFKLDRVFTYRAHSGRPVLGANSNYLGTGALRKTNEALGVIENANPDVAFAQVLTLRQGYLVVCARSMHVAAPLRALGVQRAATPEDLMEWSRREASISPPLDLGYADLVRASAPLLTADGRMLGWLALDFSVATWAASQAQARFQAFFIVALGGGLLILFALHRLEIRRRSVVSRTAEMATAADRAKTAFLGKVSHELRTPIQSMLGYAEMLEAVPLEPEARRWLAAARSHGQLLTRLVNDLLDLSALQAGAFRLVPKPADLAALTRSVVDALEPRARAKQLRLTLEFDAGLEGWRMFDTERVRQILLNLVGNAVKFTARGTVTLSARVAPGAPHDEVLLAVVDSGPGIAPEDQELLFRPFSRLDPATDTEGSGLGLALSAALCQAMQGELSVESDGRTGSTFRARLPLPRCDPPTASQPARDAALGGRRILVADDNTLVRELFVTALRARGAECLSAADGLEAIERACDGSVDTIIVDISMPWADGYEVTRRLRSSARGPLRIIGVSAHTGADENERARQAGMDIFLVKPVALADLVAAVAGTTAPPLGLPPPEVAASLQRQFTEEAERLRRSLCEAAASADLTRLRHTAHYLKNSADVMHYSALSRRCRDLEAAVFPGGVAAKSADYGAATQRVIAELDQVAPPTL